MSQTHAVGRFPPPLQTAPGVAAEAMRAVDWSRTSLGPPDRWPPTLVTTLATILYSRNPMYLWWGPESVCFYNDTALPSMPQGKHPRVMGQPGREAWPEIWPVIGPQIDEAQQRAKPSWHEDQLVPMFRHGAMEDAYWTYGYSPVFDPTGAVVGTLVVSTETTSRVLAELHQKDARRQAETAHADLQSFLMQLPLGVAFLDGPEHVFTLANPLFMALLFGGRPDTDLLGKPVRVAVPEVEGMGYYELLDRVFHTGEPYVAKKMRAVLQQDDGSSKELYVNFTYQPKYDRQGDINGILAVVYEVTDQVNESQEIEQLARNLQQALTARDAFLGIAAHELKTPLTSLKLQTQMSRRLLQLHGAAAITPPKLERLIDHTIRQADRLARLVDDMLDVSRINSGKLTMEFASTDLTALLAETVERFGPQLSAAGTILTQDIAPGLTASVDAFRLEQVLANLLHNAIKYAPESRLHLSAQSRVARVWISLRDEGPGIAQADHKRIFERFERAVPSTHTSGLGLGLHIARQIVEAHGGHLVVSSEPGEGATFTFDLPPEGVGERPAPSSLSADANGAPASL